MHRLCSGRHHVALLEDIYVSTAREQVTTVLFGDGQVTSAKTLSMPRVDHAATL